MVIAKVGLKSSACVRYETTMNTNEEINLDLTKVEENLLKRKSRVAFEQEVWRVFCQEMTMSHETNSATKSIALKF